MPQIIGRRGLRRLAELATMQAQSQSQTVISAEAGAVPITHGDIRKRLSRALMTDHEAKSKLRPDTYVPAPYVTDVVGDHKSGTVYSEQGGKFHKRDYKIKEKESGHQVALGDPSEVVPRAMYDDVSPASVQALEADGASPSIFTLERNIPQAERDAAGDGDFAGKGKSFPILKKADVKAAVASMGRAGKDNHDAATLKANIKRIAKKKGWASELPDDWKESNHVGNDPGDEDDDDGDDDADLGDIVHDGAEAGAVAGDVADADLSDEYCQLDLVESAVGQDGTAKIKLVSPGWGKGVNSEGMNTYYSEALLKRDGPIIFKRGLKMYWNHATESQEAERPEGSLDDFAAVLTGHAYWDKGPAGAGLYAPIKVNKVYREAVDDLAPYIGVSIRASGLGRPGKVEGKEGIIPDKLTRSKSVDFVTEPGAGGKILQLFESARPARSGGSNSNLNQNGDNMTDQERKDFVALQEANGKLVKRMDVMALREIRTEAGQYAGASIEALKLPVSTKKRIVMRARESAPINADTLVLDTVAFDKLIKVISTEEANYLVTSMRESGIGTMTGISDLGMNSDGTLVQEATLDEAKIEAELQEAMGNLMGKAKDSTAAKVAGRGTLRLVG